MPPSREKAASQGGRERSTTLSRILIYTEPRCPALDFAELANYVEGRLPGVPVELKPPLIEGSMGSNKAGPAAPLDLDEIARAWAQAKIKKFDAPPPQDQSVLAGEVDYERRRITNCRSQVYGLLYDAFAVAGIYRTLLEAEVMRIDSLPIIFTNQLVGTWDDSDRRYHARTVICGSPAIISLSGLVEAPAKERGYYLARRSSEALGLPEEEKLALAGSLAGEHLQHDDPRLTEVVKGYVMQAAAYRITGEPFCQDPHCRLYNAHWQRELINSQLGGPYEYCPAHRNMLPGGVG